MVSFGPFGRIATRQTGRAHHRGSVDFLDWRLNAQAKIRKMKLRIPQKTTGDALKKTADQQS